MKFTLTLTFALILLISCNGDSQKSKTTDPAIAGMIETFFEKYKTSPSEATAYIFGTNTSFSSQQVSEFNDKIASASLTIGLYKGYEEITSKSTSESLVLHSYLVRHDKQPLRFAFIFYKPNDKWILYQLKFDDNVVAELEESGKVYFIQ